MAKVELRKLLESGHVDTAGYGMYVVGSNPPPQFNPSNTDGSSGSDVSSTSGLGSTSSITSIDVNEIEEEEMDF